MGTDGAPGQRLLFAQIMRPVLFLEHYGVIWSLRLLIGPSTSMGA